MNNERRTFHFYPSGAISWTGNKTKCCNKVYTPTSNAEVAKVEWFYEGLQDLLELTPKIYALFITGHWNANVGSPEITWSNRQVWSWSTKWSRAKANRVLPGEHTDHNKHPLPTTEEMTLHMDIPDGQYWKQTVFFAAKGGETLYSQQK